MSFLQLQLFTLTVYWWVVYSCGISRPSLCPLCHHPMPALLYSPSSVHTSQGLCPPQCIFRVNNSFLVEKLLLAVIHLKLLLYHAKANRSKANQHQRNRHYRRSEPWWCSRVAVVCWYLPFPGTAFHPQASCCYTGNLHRGLQRRHGWVERGQGEEEGEQNRISSSCRMWISASASQGNQELLWKVLSVCQKPFSRFWSTACPGNVSG